MSVIFIDPIVAMLHNQKTDRWHPILFVGSPLPGGDGPMRHKSKGHHTAGFDTREQADVGANELKDQVIGARMVDTVFEWDGEDMPAMVEFFPDRHLTRPTAEQSADNQSARK